MRFNLNLKKQAPFILLLFVGLFFRLYNNEFGLPHSLYADEPEIAEFAIKYTYELRSIIANKDFYKLVPVSFVYGTVPTYFFTVTTILFSKTNNLLGITFDKSDIYIFSRSLLGTFSMLIAYFAAKFYKYNFKDTFGTLVVFGLIALNWKLIVMGHYLNHDVVITILITGALYTASKYYDKESDTLYTCLTGILMGLAIGTKITAVISLPAFLYLYFKKKDFIGFFGLLFIIYGIFAVTNPFSLIFMDRFALRILEMKTKEAGLVFDSVDTNPFKYFSALGFITNPFVLAFSLTGIYFSIKTRVLKNSKHVLLIGHILIYLIFFSLGNRRVDRWLLPLIPVIGVYAAYGLSYIKTHIKKINFITMLIIFSVAYVYYPILLLTQFNKNTPKSEAYLWAQQNIPELSFKYVITEEGLDPMNKLKFANVKQFEVYSTEGAQFSLPENPKQYDYVIISSRPMTNFKRKEVIEAFPAYAERWLEFEKMLQNNQEFELIKSFELTKPNLIPLSDVYIYKNLDSERQRDSEINRV